MNEDQKRHIVGAIRNHVIHRSVFEPVPGYGFAWRDGFLYRLPDGSPFNAHVGLKPLLTQEELYGMDDETLFTRAMGGKTGGNT